MNIQIYELFNIFQPALLYLSPACILSVLITAAVRGELGKVFAYKSEASKKNAAAKLVEETKTKKADSKKKK